MLLLKILLITPLFFICRSVQAFEPFSIGITGIVLAGGYLYQNKIKCLAGYECCHEPEKNLNWINYYPTFANLESNIFGQHIAIKVVTKIMIQHMRNHHPKKALLLSFHGYTGIGKNHLSKLIAKEIYQNYRETNTSKFVHTLVATHFLTNNHHQDRVKLKAFVEEGIKNCERSLFIIDEIDKFPEKILDSLIPYVENNNKLDGHSYNKAIFLLLGNSGGELINAKTKELKWQGIHREDLEFHHFEEIIRLNSFHKGGLKNSDLIDRGVIDIFVPFLPLERKHIIECIKQYLREHYNYSSKKINQSDEIIKKIADQVCLDSNDEFVRFGCRRVPYIVDIYLY